MESSQVAAGEDVSCALALVNTRHLRAGKEIDQLSNTGSMTEWLAGRGLIRLGATPGPGDAARLVTLREAVRELFTASASGARPPEHDIARLNAALTAAPIIPSLTWDERGPRRGEQVPAEKADPVGGALARIAADALAVLTEPGGPRAAPCQAHGCIRWFLRTHAARQWCSNRCGDRVRAARHYTRQRARLRIRARCRTSPFTHSGALPHQPVYAFGHVHDQTQIRIRARYTDPVCAFGHAGSGRRAAGGGSGSGRRERAAGAGGGSGAT